MHAQGGGGMRATRSLTFPLGECPVFAWERKRVREFPVYGPPPMSSPGERGSKYCYTAWSQGYFFQSKPMSIPTPAAMSTDCNGLLRILASRPFSSSSMVV